MLYNDIKSRSENQVYSIFQIESSQELPPSIAHGPHLLQSQQHSMFKSLYLCLSTSTCVTTQSSLWCSPFLHYRYRNFHYISSIWIIPDSSSPISISLNWSHLKSNFGLKICKCKYWHVLGIRNWISVETTIQPASDHLCLFLLVMERYPQLSILPLWLSLSPPAKSAKQSNSVSAERWVLYKYVVWLQKKKQVASIWTSN